MANQGLPPSIWRALDIELQRFAEQKSLMQGFESAQLFFAEQDSLRRAGALAMESAWLADLAKQDSLRQAAELAREPAWLADLARVQKSLSETALLNSQAPELPGCHTPRFYQTYLPGADFAAPAALARGPAIWAEHPIQQATTPTPAPAAVVPLRLVHETEQAAAPTPAPAAPDQHTSGGKYWTRERLQHVVDVYREEVRSSGKHGAITRAAARLKRADGGTMGRTTLDNCLKEAERLGIDTGRNASEQRRA